MPLPASAQQAAGNPPAGLETLDESAAPAVTIRQPAPQSRAHEYRAPGGRVTEIEVSSGGSTYYLKPNTQAGSAIYGDGESTALRAPQWQIGVFDFRRSQEEKAAQAAAAASTPPPPALDTETAR